MRNPYVNLFADTTASSLESDSSSLMGLYGDYLDSRVEAQEPFKIEGATTSGSPRDRFNEWQGGARGLAQAQSAQAPLTSNFIEQARANDYTVFDYRGDPNEPFDPQKVFISDDLPKDATIKDITELARILQPDLLAALPSFTGTGSGTGKFIDTKEGRRFDWNQDSGLNKVTNVVGDIAPAVALGFATGGLGSSLAAGGMSAGAANALASTVGQVGMTGDISNVDDIVKNAALSYAGGAIGEQAKAASEYGTGMFSDQTNALLSQNAGMGAAPYSFTSNVLGGTAGNLVRGEDPVEAITGALGGAASSELKWADSPDTSFNFETPQVVKDIGNAIVSAGEGVYEAQKPIGQAIADAAEPVYENVIKPAGKALDDYVIDPVVDAAQYVDDEYIDPFVSTVKEEVFDPIQEVGREIDRGVLQPTKDVIEAGYEAQKPIVQEVVDTVDDAIRAIPNLELPDVDLPDIDLPDIDWKGLFGIFLGGASGMFSGGGGGMGVAKPQEDAITTELLDYKPITPFRSKLSPNVRLIK